MRRIGHALASLRWRLTLTFIALLLPLLVLLAGYQFLTLRESLITNRVAELQGDFTSAKRLIATKEKALGATTTAALRLCATHPEIVGPAVASAVSTVTGQTVQVIVYDSGLTEEAVAPVGANPPQLDSAVLQGVLDRGTRSLAQVITTNNGQQLVVGFPVLAGSGACGVAQLSVSMTPITNVLHDEILLITAGGLVVLALALALGVLLTGRTLRPMRRLTATAEQLAAGDLTARSRLTPSRDEVGQLASSFDHMADRIEEAFRAQQDSEAQVRRFIADASHELRTPLTALKGYIDVLRRGAGREPAVLDSASRGDEQRIRAHARARPRPPDPRAPGRRARIAPGGLRPQRRRQRPAQRRRAGNARAGRAQLGPAPLYIHADRSAVTTIVRNLLVNACKYARGAAQHWSSTAEAGWAKLELRDEGPGIPASDLPHVFERFYRGEKTRAREEGGSGLGLSIVQGLAKAQGGDVAIRSIEGAGTTVTVWFPLAPVPPPPPTG